MRTKYQPKSIKLYFHALVFLCFYKNINRNPKNELLSSFGKQNFFVNVVSQAIVDSTPPIANDPCLRKVWILAPWWDTECSEIRTSTRLLLGNAICRVFSWISTFLRSDALLPENYSGGIKGSASETNSRTSQTFVWNKCRFFKNNYIKVEKSSSPENLQKDALHEGMRQHLHLHLPECPPILPRYCEK